MKLIFAWIAGSLLMFSCVVKPKEPVQPIDTATLTNTHQLKVEDVIQTTSYTYLLGNENGQEVWIAVTKMEAQTGDVFYYDNALEMLDFESKELNRVFDRVLFVEDLRSLPDKTMDMHHQLSAHGQRKSNDFQPDIRIDPVAGGVTIADLYKNRADYRDKKVVVRGKVVKVNNGIMERNWIHLQDGTTDNGKFDLTFTSQENIAPNDIVTLEGIVALDKDFGAGYFYELIVEEASLKK
ncbi:hypothetical protein [Gaoshiqia sp. Z1-71]|uniref:hypothetical protein n=1 Tax=Gaoshiqia hydrogeniformans TaxID=3290090 RepID=UPI003BF8020F